MASNFEADYRSKPASSGRGADDAVSVLYVDGDGETLATVTERAERADDPLAVWGITDPATALDAVRSNAWDRLVVGDGVPTADRRRLLAAADCPTVQFTATGGDGTDDSAAADVDAVVERGTDDCAVEALLDAVRDQVVPCREGELPDSRDEPTDPRDELARVDRADAMVRNVVRELGRASTREELELAVCEHVAVLDEVAMAWVGKREGGNDRIVPGTVVGEPKQYLRDAVARTSVDDAAGGPVLRAIESGEAQVVDDFRTDDRVSHWRELALSYDLSSLAMVPLTHGDTVHGVLAVYGERPGAITDVLADRLALLGDAVGFATTAVQNRRLLERDGAVELEFQSNGEDACLVPVARACGCRLEAIGSVDLGDEALQYLRVDGAPVAAVVDEADERAGVSDARVVRSVDPEGGVVELRAETALQIELSDVGARLREAVATRTGTRVVVEASRDGDVRAIHDVVCRSNPDANLVSKTDVDGPYSGPTDGVTLDDVLTDRQRDVLQAAHLAGYYAWPRDVTAEELAESLDIASPTLHQHVRRAERNILAALFDD